MVRNKYYHIARGEGSHVTKEDLTAKMKTENINQNMNSKMKLNMKLAEVDIKSSMSEIARGLDERPGIYIFSEDDRILYVGKARNLRKRVSSYLNVSRLNNKSRRVMERANRLQWLLTSSNTEALLLEYNFIKQHRPPYNVLLKDDKSYPYIALSYHHPFPMLVKHRGPQKKQAKYFGPYPNSIAVNRSIDEMQKIFQIRSCTDSVFANRQRPCLQHQIGRCSAPCVGAISEEDYAKNVDFVKDFLSGKDTKVINELSDEMQKAADEMRFEDAASLRNKVQAMRNLNEKQYISKHLGRTIGDLDALSVYSHGNNACVYVLNVRNGRIANGKHFFFRAPAFDTELSLMISFITQYYLQNEVPNEIITTYEIPREIFEDLREHHNSKIKTKHTVRGMRRRWLNMSHESCKSLLINHMNSKHSMQQEMEQLNAKMMLDVDIKRIECFDISHMSGKQTQASCVVFTEEGPAKQEYRRFNIQKITEGDDYAAMRQAVHRKYSKADYADDEGLVILIDGGVGQLKAALKGLYDLYTEAEDKSTCAFMHNSVVIGVAKDSNRKFGKEKIIILRNYLPPIKEDDISDNLEIIELSSINRQHTMEILLRVRDEAHRFAIRGHRKKRNKIAMSSGLDKINGLGESRKKELIKHFGGVLPIKDASIEDLAQVPGFGNKLAEKVYQQLRK